MWVATANGLNRYDGSSVKVYRHDPDDPYGLSNNAARAIYLGRNGTVWVGTHGGLNKLDRQTETFTHDTTANGLSGDTIYRILEDEQGRLWLSTTDGLSRFDPRTESFRNYDVSDGLQSNTFLNTASYSKSRSGEMFFGGSNGFNAFYPDQIADDQNPAPFYITEFLLANKPLPIGAEPALQKSILETDNLVVSYLDRVFSFEFAVRSAV
jgi:hypothetical protein